MADINENITEHARLVQELESLDYAPPTLKQVESQLDGVSKKLAEEQKQLKKLESATKKEYCEWIAIRDRTHKRFIERIKHPRSGATGLSEKEAKEEREYVEAFEKENKLRAEVEGMEKQVAQFKDEIGSLQQLAKRHEVLRRQLDALYERVFGGPTPSHPQEDQAEQAYKAALEAFNQVQTEMTNESRAFNLLNGADKSMVMAHKAMSDAISASTWDMWGGGLGADMMERSALSDAQRFADQAKLYLSQAQQLQPMIKDIARVEVPRMSMGDVMFDNVFSDMAMHDKIKRSANQFQQSHIQLRSVIGQSHNHLQWLQDQARGREQTLTSARKELDQVRRRIMEEAGQPLPVYSEGPRGGDQVLAGAPPPQPYQSAPQGQYRGNPFAEALERRDWQPDSQ